MTRWLLFPIVLGCNGGDGVPPVFVDDTSDTSSDTGAPDAPGPLREARLRLGAIFRYDSATGLPGAWLDESTGDSTSAIEFIVGDDEYDGTNGAFCLVSVPIRAADAQPLSPLELQRGQYWGANLAVEPAAVATNCDEPEYARIWDFFNGNVVEFLTTNIDGSAANWAIIVEEPSSNAVTWLTGAGSQFEEAQVIGGEIRLSNRWSQSRVNAIATLGWNTDAQGVILVDDAGENVPILLDEIDDIPGIKEGVYRFIGYQYQVVTNVPN